MYQDFHKSSDYETSREEIEKISELTFDLKIENPLRGFTPSRPEAAKGISVVHQRPSQRKGEGTVDSLKAIRLLMVSIAF
ncbi:hypothetical protein HOP50_17g80190 [Chloropicon primus]|uniref:Uncharacterized protein n=1 Tax=Chloropicon primus TaxID=1764295 RepID=A0A5B8MXZ7_9CHLO|nr:hypothetical protein A3770_17p79970 [Chloropicon primus]UPR04675.1 hypothetical protein HOP50_17g80190 [Chloropicon primus]|eukprot:QDZ25479.1 hypothetical protein A3770_17p79970 [Chloropicon primus]